MLKFERDIERAHVGSIDRHFYINGPIVDVDDYVGLIDTLYMGKPNETIVLHLNTPGGDLNITMQIINAMKTSEADVIAIADGQVASAGSLILFAASSIGVQPYSYVMMHDGGEGLGGKANENLKQAQFTSKLLSTMAHSIYEPFFTKDEIDAVLEGKDMWLTSEEVEERITNLTKPEKEVNAEE